MQKGGKVPDQSGWGIREGPEKVGQWSESAGQELNSSCPQA